MDQGHSRRVISVLVAPLERTKSWLARPPAEFALGTLEQSERGQSLLIYAIVCYLSFSICTCYSFEHSESSFNCWVQSESLIPSFQTFVRYHMLSTEQLLLPLDGWWQPAALWLLNARRNTNTREATLECQYVENSQPVSVSYPNYKFMIFSSITLQFTRSTVYFRGWRSYSILTQMKLLIWLKVQYIQTYSESHIDTDKHVWDLESFLLDPRYSLHRCTHHNHIKILQIANCDFTVPNCSIL